MTGTVEHGPHREEGGPRGGWVMSDPCFERVGALESSPDVAHREPPPALEGPTWHAWPRPSQAPAALFLGISVRPLRLPLGANANLGSGKNLASHSYTSV